MRAGGGIARTEGRLRRRLVESSGHAACRFRPPPRPFRLLAVRGRDPYRRPGEAVRQGGDAGGRRDRHQQPVRRAGILARRPRRGRAADRGLPALRRPQRGARQRRRGGAGPARAAGAERGRLREPAGADQPRLPRHRAARGAACHAGRPRGEKRGADRADRRAGRRRRAAAGGGPGARRRGDAADARGHLPGPALCRGHAPRPGRGGAHRERPHRPRLPLRPAADRDQRGVLRHARHVRGA